MRFEYHPSEDFQDPLKKRLGRYPRVPDLTWDTLRWLAGTLGMLVVRSFFRVEVAGRLPKDLRQTERVAVVANHQSHLDTVSILAALPGHRRRQVCVLAAEDYFFTKTPNAIMASLFSQGVAFDRLHWTAIRGWYKHLQAARRGWILFYPSGSRKSRKLNDGLLRLLLKAGWTILPVRLEGTDTAWPIDARSWRPLTKIRVTFCEPYTGTDIEALDEKLIRELGLEREG